VAILFAPVILILGLVLIGDSNQASSATVPANKAEVAVAFSSTFAGQNDVSPTSFQRVLLNVVSVRLNASTTAGNISDFAAGWVTIGVPAGVGINAGISTVQTGNNFGGSSGNGNNVTIGTGRAEIQIDLGAIQNIAEVFNAQAVPARTYHHVELVLDPVTPGNVVPLCPQTFPAGEGCISYKAQFATPTPTPAGTLSIQTEATIDLSKGNNVVTPLLIQIDPGVGTPPTSFSQGVSINPSICVPGNSASCTPTASNVPQLGVITGTVTDNVAFSSSRSVSITALNAGTNNIVLTQALSNSCKGKKTCDFVMSLPAAFAIAGGTNYDFVASGKSTSYAAVANVNLSSGVINSTPLSFAVTSKTTVSFTGKVLDACNGIGVPAATLNLLVPDTTITKDCSANPPTGCVVAASASTDETGLYPLPGSGVNPTPFSMVPLPAVGTSYELVTTAAGYDRTFVNVTKNASSLECTPTSTSGKCYVGLPHGIMTGNVTLGGGDTGPLSVLVAAEDSGTNNIENLILVTVPSGGNTAPFTMNVPDDANQNASGETIADLDLFASTQDLFNGAPQQATGHTFAVAGDIAAPAASTSGCITASQNPNLSGMTCVGHGSVAGLIAIPAGVQPPSTATVVLAKDDVQIETVGVAAPDSLLAGRYALCAPADPAAYTLIRYEVVPTPAPGATPSPTPTGTPAPFPTPAPVSSASVTLTPPVEIESQSPCPGICLINPPNANSGCLTCFGTNGPSGL